jgi:hypothetical protein
LLRKFEELKMAENTEVEEFGYAGEDEKCQHETTKDRTVFNSNGGITTVKICDECGMVVHPT